MLVVIGPAWATSAEEGQPRLFSETDLVRTEVATALIRPDVLVVPVLVNGATMPKAEQLPEPLKPLATRQAIELSDTRWGYDVDQLSIRLKGELDLTLQPNPAGPSHPISERPPKRRTRITIAAAIIILAAVVAVTTVFLNRSPNVDDMLQSGDSLQPDDILRSANGRYELSMQAEDGNLVIYDKTRPTDHQAIAATGTIDAPGAFAVMQKDGNFVVYRSRPPIRENSIYSTQTVQYPGATLTLTDSGELVLTSAQGERIKTIRLPQ